MTAIALRAAFVMLLLYALALYVAIGVLTAVAFVTVGLSQVLPPAMTASVGARIVLLPGSVALWPYVLARWRQARRR